MCGLAGFSGSFDARDLRAMNELLAHRGPDGEGLWVDESAGIGLGHRRLAIIDLRPEADQPMTNEDGSVRVIVNGEIYNFRELRAELEGKGHIFKSRSDVEVVVHLYEEVGTAAIERLEGIFALALWDANEQRLVVARDHLGVKPLYYAELPGGFVFASELKALRVFGQLSRELDPFTLHQHLSFIWSAAPRTMLKGVQKVEPGFCMTVRDGRIERKWSYYDLGYNGQYSADSYDNQVARVSELTARAVKRQMVSDVPVGAFLSGGVDSSGVVAMMKRAGADRIPCYTIGFVGSGDDGAEDLPFARDVARHLGVDLREVHVDPDVVSFAEQMVYHLDEPQADPACINVHLICERARGDGVKVLLSGAGGDDLFSGYRRHTAVMFERYWSWLPQTIRSGLRQSTARLGARSSAARRVGKAFSYADIESDERLMTYFLWSTDATRRALYTSELDDQLASYDSLAPLRASLGRIPAERNALNRMLYLEAKHFLPDHNLNYTDKMSMRHGVEVRVPLLDLDLVDYAVHLPPATKQKGRFGKRIFKDALRPFLPAGVMQRPKAGFGAPLRRWITGDLREMVRDVLSVERLERRGLFRPAAVLSLIEANERGDIDASYTIFSLMCIELWMNAFTDRPAPTVVV